MTSITYIGSTLAVAVGKPATEDATTYKALAWSDIGKIISIGEVGDSSEDVTIPLLETGRTVHVNGVQDIGDIAITAEFDSDDARQTLMRGASGTNTSYSFRVRDADNNEQYFNAVVADYRVTERTASSFKGIMFAIRGQSAIVTDGPPAILVREDPFYAVEGLSGGQRERFYFKLATQPSGNVTVTITQSDGATVIISQGGSKTFTPSNWDVYQNFRVEVPEDSDTIDETEQVILTAAGGGYNNVSRTVNIILEDNDE